MKKVLFSLLIATQVIFAITINNGLQSTDLGYISVNVGNAGETRDVTITAKTGSSQTTTEIVYDYFTYVQVGSRAFRLSSKTSEIFKENDYTVISKGIFSGSNGNDIEWKCTSTIEPHSKIYRNDFSFKSLDNNLSLGKIKLYQYLDEDVMTTANIFFTRGDYCHGNLELFTVNPSNSIGISHGGNYDTTNNSQFVGWALDSYNAMKGRIVSGNQNLLQNGYLHRTGKVNHPVYAEVYGIWDIVSVLGWQVDENTTDAKITTTLGGVVYSGELNEKRVDLTVGGLKVNYLDDGTLNVQVRVANAGLKDFDNNSSVVFILTDENGTVKERKELDLITLSQNSYKDINTSFINFLDNDSLTVWVDEYNVVRELNERNNNITVKSSNIIPLSKILVSTNKASYSSNELVQLQGLTTNLGKLEANLTAQLTLSDLEGNIIQVFDAQPLGIVASGERKTVSNEWNTSNTLAGEYLLKGTLTDKNGVVVYESTVVFDVVHSGVSAVLDLRLDKAIYSTSDSVQLDNYIRSLSTNSMIKDASIEIEVTNSTQQVMHTQTLRLGTLLPESRRDVAGVYDFMRLAIGEYKVKATLKGDNNISYDTDIQTFKIEENVDSGLKGSVNLAWREGYIGAEQTCNYSVSNLGSSVLNNLPLSVKIIDMDNGNLRDEYLKNILLNPLDKEEKSKKIQTQSYQARTYSCGLYVKVHNEWRLLDHKLFTLKYLHAPKAYNDFKNVAHGASAVIDVLHNDSIIKNNLDFSTFRLIDNSGKKVESLRVANEGVWHIQSDGQIVFVPQKDYIGDPTPVSYSIKDYTGAILSAKIYLNYPPVAYADSGKTVFGKSVEIGVLGNDKKTSSPFDVKHIRLIDGNNKEQKILSTEKGFWQVDSHKGIIRFTPREDDKGQDSIMYVVYDKGGDKTNKATVSVQIAKAIKPSPPPVVHPPSCNCGCGCRPTPMPTPIPVPTPTPAPIVSPVVETNSATIHWQDKTYDEIGYMIYQNGVLIAVVDEDVTTLYVEGLENNTKYTFEIVSFDGYGNHTKQFIHIKTTLGMGWFTAILHALLG